MSGTTLVNGAPVAMGIRAYDIQTGGIMWFTASNASGAFSMRLPLWASVYVMTVPPEGVQPITHGPIVYTVIDV
jgi:hypothetical protein